MILLSGLHFNNQLIFNYNVCPIREAHVDAVVNAVHRNFHDRFVSTLIQFVSEHLSVDGFKKAWTKSFMNYYCYIYYFMIYYFMGKTVELFTGHGYFLYLLVISIVGHLESGITQRPQRGWGRKSIFHFCIPTPQNAL